MGINPRGEEYANEMRREPIPIIAHELDYARKARDLWLKKKQ